jgi:hypothetical protein
MCGTSSFEVALAQIIAQTGPPPSEATPTATPRPAEKAVRPLSSGHEAAVPPQPSKKANNHFLTSYHYLPLLEVSVV